MERILTDPDLCNNSEESGLQTLRNKNLQIQFLKQENKQLLERLTDLQTSLGINKQIIAALIDSTKNDDYKSSFELFQQEIQCIYDQKQIIVKENDRLSAQLLIQEQIKSEAIQKCEDNLLELQLQKDELKDSIERKEYQLQCSEKRANEYEYLLKEIAVYDDYVKGKLQQLNIRVTENQEQKISNVVYQNKQLSEQLQAAQQEIDSLKQLLEAVSDLNQNNVNNDMSYADIQILNQLLNKNKQNIHNNYKTEQSHSNQTDLPSVKLFKRMTTLKKGKNDLEKECRYLKEKLEDYYFLNNKLSEELTKATQKVQQYENEISKSGSTNNKGESTNVNESSIIHQSKHKRRISFDPKFLAQASPQQMQKIKQTLQDADQEKQSFFLDISAL